MKRDPLVTYFVVVYSASAVALAVLWRDPALSIAPRWYLLLLVPPAAIAVTLTTLRVTVSPALPGWLWFGIPIGMVAGFLKEFGWTGFAYPRMRARFGAAAGALLLGIAWGAWHLPVVDRWAPPRRMVRPGWHSLQPSSQCWPRSAASSAGRTTGHGVCCSRSSSTRALQARWCC